MSDLQQFSNNANHLPQHILEKSLENQEKEIAYRMQELELRKQNDANNFEIARLAGL